MKNGQQNKSSYECIIRWFISEILYSNKITLTDPTLSLAHMKFFNSRLDSKNIRKGDGEEKKRGVVGVTANYSQNT